MTEEKKKRISEHMDDMRERTGHEASENPLVSFLYELMRDHVSCGTIEGILVTCDTSRCIFTNGYLARYAKDIAKRLEDGSMTADHDIGMK